MNEVERAVGQLTRMEDLQALASPLHQLAPLAKLLAVLLYLILVISFGKYDLGRLFPMVLYPVILYTLSGIDIGLCFYRLRMVLPLVMAAGLLNPFFDRSPVAAVGSFVVTGGMISMAVLMLKGVFCLMASFWLMAATSLDAVCGALRLLHVPDFLVTLLLLTFRYIGVMAEELSVMSDAYHLRAPRQKGIAFSAWGSFLGQAFLRSADRAEELYEAMLLRGYHGDFFYADTGSFGWRELLFLMLTIGFLVLVRLGDPAGWLGRLSVMVMGD